MVSVEALLVAAAFVIIGVIAVLTFQGMGKSASEALRANAIVTTDRAGFDVTVEVLNGRLSGVLLAYAQSGQNLGNPITGRCVTARQIDGLVESRSLNMTAGQSATCRFPANLTAGIQYTYVIYAIDASSGKTVQVAKGVVTVGIS
ncbi:MAG: hypothetical protein ACK4M3_04340 [Pyrobaculum sp.]